MEYVDLSDASGREITGIDFSDKVIDAAYVENCVFRKCSFNNTGIINSRIEGSKFVDCSILNPDFSNSRLIDVEFFGCKIVGLALFKCNQTAFDLAFDACMLSYCNFADVGMKRNVFNKCEIRESYFQNALLAEARFTGCVFSSSTFNRCDLRKSSFVQSDGYAIDPRDCRIEKAAFSMPGVLGLLMPFDIEIE